MPLYTDPGYSYYSSSGGSMYSPYYSAPMYGSSTSSSSPYAPYSSSYNRSYNGTYVLPSTPRSTQYTTLVSRYQPKLSTITESPLTSRGGYLPLTRIQSPKVSTYTPSISSKYISTRPARPRTINTADIDVSASSRYGRHHHMEERKHEEEKTEAEEVLSANNTDSDASSSIADANSPYMPRVDGTDCTHHARSTIKRNRAVVRLSIMRPRSRGEPKGGQGEATKDPDRNKSEETTEATTDKKDSLERMYIHDKTKEEGLQITVTDMEQSQNSESSLSEMIIEVDPVTHTVRRLSIPQVPSFHDICEDISSDKIDDDLNAGELRRRASIIQEQEIEILNELQKSQSGSIQVIHLERNKSQDDCRKSRKSKKTKKIRHKITANVYIDNSPTSLTPVIQQTIDEDSTSASSANKTPKFSFSVEDIEEHKVFKLPRKKVKSIKTKKADESVKEKTLKPAPPDKKEEKPVIAEEPQPKVATPKPIRKIEKSESGEDFWSQIGSRETQYMNKRKKALENQSSSDKDSVPTTPIISGSGSDGPMQSFSPQDEKKTEIIDNRSSISETPTSPLSPDWTFAGDETPKSAVMPSKSSSANSDLNKTASSTSTSQPSTPLSPKSQYAFDEESKSPPKPTSPKKLITKVTPSTEMQKKDDQIKKPLTLTKLEKTPKDVEGKKDDQAPTTPKKATSKTQDSPKTKTTPKLAAKKKSSPKNNAKEETPALETISKPKTKPSAPTLVTGTPTNADAFFSTKITSGTGAKSPEKKKPVKSDTAAIKQTITSKNTTDIATKADEKKRNEIPEKNNTKISQIFIPIQPTTPKNDISSDEKPLTCDSKPGKDAKQTDSPTTIAERTSPKLKSETKASPTATQIQGITSPATPKASTSAQQTSQVSTPTAITTASTTPSTTECSVLATSTSNLSKFATISNLAQYLLDVDAEVEDYIPSSAEETDSSSDSYSGDGSLSASMKKKNKQLKKKAKEEQQAFDPNKKIKIDPKKKLYVKDEAPRYPLIATPRPLWKREKVVYEESSNSSSEESDSGSECTTSDEYEDELSPKDATIRMSTCSNDSGFDGGTASSSSKKALECDVNCHKKCEKLMANLCGVNQKLIVEALACLKKGKLETTDSLGSKHSLNAAYKIEESDDESSYTYLQFQKSGRITAPATTIPRFKKYSVEDFHFLAVLGKGSFGKVLLAELRNTDFYYAVKCLKKDVVLEDDDVECTLIERKVLALGTKHPYLCHLFCTFQTESHLFFVMEYLNGGDLMFHIQESGRFPEDRARFYGAEIISGLKFLHKKGIIYRDLKLDNVLLDFDGHVRIADFGMCKLQIYLDKTADSFCGTPDYMAPEIIKGDKYNQNVDWWSFGVLLYEMLIGQSPFSGCDEDELFWSICNEIPWFPVYITQEATSILKGLLEKDYTKRVGSQYSPAGDICDHIFFRSIDWGLLEKRQLPPPFKPQVKHPLDTQYFDRAFTRERVRLTPIDKEILQSMDQDQFQGFSYTNPNATLD